MDLTTIERDCLAAALGETPWSNALASITSFVGGEKAMLLGSSKIKAYNVSVAHNHDPVHIEQYNSGYNLIDPRRGLSMQTPVGQVRLGQEYVRNEQISKTRYYADVTLVGDVKDSVHGVISDTPLGRYTISIQRGFAKDYFDTADAERLTAVLPVLHRSFRLSQLASSLRATGTGERQIVGLLGENFRFRSFDYADQLMLSALDDVFINKNGHLVCGADNLKIALEESVHRALATGSASFKFGDNMFELAQMPRHLGWAGSSDREAVLAISKDRIEDQLSVYAKVFAFTRRETQILKEVCQTGGLREAAAGLGISYETIRWHIKNMQAKSQTDSLQQMIQRAIRADIN